MILPSRCAHLAAAGPHPRSTREAPVAPDSVERIDGTIRGTARKTALKRIAEAARFSS